jgi:hypothetical protein
MHHGMEVRLGLSKGPICPSFNWSIQVVVQYVVHRSPVHHIVMVKSELVYSVSCSSQQCLSAPENLCSTQFHHVFHSFDLCTI